ncbi:hypothetical protein CYMTET_15515 [Cymbomonas tetramitiformis]|uniref:Uncharacterized protein n=1 Tax=Cymbomonas tetramitiformis TaxID=36881 RepID=A0AAE0GDW7_9CHLO|nr:hypothetical protein CYMTET_15515 [Cymbomonas tetramitiformis]
MEAWNAFRCLGAAGRHRMLYIKNLEGDAMTRRFGHLVVTTCDPPVPEGRCGNPDGRGGYMDILTGMPQWFIAEDAQSNLQRSAYYPIVHLDTQVTIYMYGMEPKRLQFTLLNAEPDDTLLVTVDWRRENEIDMKKKINGTWQKVEEYPANYTWTSNFGVVPQVPLSTMLAEASQYPSGTHYRNKTAQKYSFLLKGNEKVRLEENQMLRLTMSLDVSVGEFYEKTERLSDNLHCSTHGDTSK